MRYALTLTAAGHEGREDLQVHLDGHKWKHVVEEVNEHLRKKLKYTEEYKSATEELEEVRKVLWELIGESSLTLY